MTAPTQAQSERWRGIGKLAEECGEVLQLLGKAIAFPSGDHPDGRGSIRDRLPSELADLKAAIEYFEYVNNLRIDSIRQREKVERFTEWGLTGVHDLRHAEAAPQNKALREAAQNTMDRFDALPPNFAGQLPPLGLNKLRSALSTPTEPAQDAQKE